MLIAAEPAAPGGPARCSSQVDHVSVAEPSCFARGIHGQPGVCGAYSLSAQERGSLVSISAGCGVTARTYELGLLRLNLPAAHRLILRRNRDRDASSKSEGGSGESGTGSALYEDVPVDGSLTDAALLGDALEVVCPAALASNIDNIDNNFDMSSKSEDTVVFRLEGSDRAALASHASASAFPAPAAGGRNATTSSPLLSTRASELSARACGSSLCCLGTPEWGDAPLFLLPSLRPHAASPLAAHLRAAGLVAPDELSAPPKGQGAAKGPGVTLTAALVLSIASPFHRVRFLPRPLHSSAPSEGDGGASATSREAVSALLAQCRLRVVPPAEQARHPPARLLAAAPRSRRAQALSKRRSAGDGSAGDRVWPVPESTVCPAAAATVSDSGDDADPVSRSGQLVERTLVYAVPSQAALARGARARRRALAGGGGHSSEAGGARVAPVSASGRRLRPRSASGLVLNHNGNGQSDGAGAGAEAEVSGSGAVRGLDDRGHALPADHRSRRLHAGAGDSEDYGDDDDDDDDDAYSGDEEDEEGGVAYRPPPVPGAVSFLQLRTFHKFVGMATKAVLKPMIEETQDQTGLADGQSMQATLKASTMQRAPPQVIHMVKEPMRRNITNMVTEATSFVVTNTLAKSIPGVIAPHISDGMYDKVITAVVTAMTPLLERSISYDVMVAVPATLRRSLPLALTHTLTRAVTHAVVPAVAAALSHSTTANEHCRSCYYEQKGCHLCSSSEQSTYYRNYHATHFADYYSNYYTPYYYNALNKVVNKDSPDMVPQSAGSIDHTGEGTETLPMAGMSVPSVPEDKKEE